MEEIVKDYWNDSSANWFKKSASDEIILKTIDNPAWAFPKQIYGLLDAAFGDLKGKKVLVPSSGDNIAAFAFHLLGAKVTSTDIAENQLKNAKGIADKYNWDIDFICDDSMKLDKIKDEAFDLVYTSNGAHVWVSDLREMYRNFYRVLRKKGANIMFEVHPFNRPFTPDDKDLHSIKSAKFYEATGPHGEIPNYHWRIQDFVNSMTGAGFAIKHIEEFHADKDVHDNWWYDSNDPGHDKMTDLTYNPWFALPQWIGFYNIKNS